MKIEYALMSCTASPRYTEYWPVVAAAWLKLGITPVCLFIPDNPAHKLPAAPGGIVHTIPPLKNMPIGIQASILRYWGSYLYPKATIIVSDIDLYPLAQDFFHTQLAIYPDHAYIYLNHNPGDYDFRNMSNIPVGIASITKIRYLYACFHIAKGEVMHDMWQFTSNWESSCQKTAPYFLHRESKLRVTRTTSHKSSTPTCGDEIYPAIQLHYSSYRPTFYVSYQPDQRYKGYITYENIFKRSIQIGAHYTLAHFSPLRYAEYKTIIDHLIKRGRLPKLYLILSWLVENINYPSNNGTKFGIWLSLLLISLFWLFLRLSSPFIHYHKKLRADLFCQRMRLLEQNPPTMQLYRRLLRIKNIFMSLK